MAAARRAERAWARLWARGDLDDRPKGQRSAYCFGCGALFSSRNVLFQHLRAEPTHEHAHPGEESNVIHLERGSATLTAVSRADARHFTGECACPRDIPTPSLVSERIVRIATPRGVFSEWDARSSSSGSGCNVRGELYELPQWTFGKLCVRLDMHNHAWFKTRLEDGREYDLPVLRVDTEPVELPHACSFYDPTAEPFPLRTPWRRNPHDDKDGAYAWEAVHEETTDEGVFCFHVPSVSAPSGLGLGLDWGSARATRRTRFRLTCMLATEVRVTGLCIGSDSVRLLRHGRALTDWKRVTDGKGVSSFLLSEREPLERNNAAARALLELDFPCDGIQAEELEVEVDLDLESHCVAGAGGWIEGVGVGITSIAPRVVCAFTSDPLTPPDHMARRTPRVVLW